MQNYVLHYISIAKMAYLLKSALPQTCFCTVTHTLVQNIRMLYASIDLQQQWVNMVVTLCFLDQRIPDQGV